MDLRNLYPPSRNVWTNPELTCQHADPETGLKAGGKASLELKSLIIQGTLEEVLAKVRQQRDRMRTAANASPATLPSAFSVP